VVSGSCLLPQPLLTSSRWDYVQRHHVQLPDEYDFLHRNLEVFWGVSPISLEHRREEWALNPGTFTLGKDDPSAKVGIAAMNVQENGDMSNVEWRADLQ
jgi:hypothetical protein